MLSVKSCFMKAMVKNEMMCTRLLIASLVLLLTTAAMMPVDGLVDQLRLDYAAFLSAESDFRERRESGELIGEEATDYAAWVAGLQRRVFEDCAAVVRSGVPFPDDLPCPVIVPPMTQSVDVAPQFEQTQQERVASLDAELLEGLGEYDEKLLQEQERIEAATPNNNETGGGGGGSGNGGGSEGSEGSEGSDGSIGGQSTAAGEGEKADGSESGAAGGQPQTGIRSSGGGPGNMQGVSGQPEDIPDGSDDDIVARQLREAAEKETDPELKKKLWEEYRKYKQGTR